MNIKTADTKAQRFCFNFFALALCPSGSMDLAAATTHMAHCLLPYTQTNTSQKSKSHIFSSRFFSKSLFYIYLQQLNKI